MGSDQSGPISLVDMRSLLSPGLLARCALALFALGVPVTAQSLSDWVGLYTSDDGRTLDLRLAQSKLTGTYRPSASIQYPLTITAQGSELSCSYALSLGRVRFTLRKSPEGVRARFVAGEVRFRRGLPSLAELLAKRPKTDAPIPALAALGPPRVDAERKWTILCYMAADNDLEAAGVLDLLEMRDGLPESGVEVLVLIDRAEGFATEPEGDWTDTRLLRVTRAKPGAEATFETLARAGELDMGDPDTLASFVAGGLKSFPAPQQMLILWDHGGGWTGQCMDLDAPGSKGPTELTLVEVRQGIEKGLKLAGDDRLDAVGFDQCLMAQLETAVELKDVADYLLASEAIEPGYGWPYRDLLPLFAAGRPTVDILRDSVDAFARFYAPLDDATTLSVLDLRQTDDYLGRFETLLDRCQDLLPKSWPKVSRNIYGGENYADRSDILRGEKALASVDLFDVLIRTRFAIQPFPFEAEWERFEQAHGRFVAHRHAGPSHWFSNGVSIYAPPTNVQWNPDYRQTRLGSRPAWTGFLAKLHELAAADRSPLRFSNGRVVSEFGRPIEAVRALEGDALQVELQGNNVIWTRLQDCAKYASNRSDLQVRSSGFLLDAKWIRRLGDGSTNLIDRMMPPYVDGKNLLRHELHGVDFLITDGRISGRATMIWSQPDATAPLAVVANYEHPDTGGFSQAEIQFDPVTWEATRVVALVQQPDGRLVPRVMPKDQGGELILQTQFLNADGTTSWQRGTSLQWSSDLRLVPAPFTMGGERVAVLTAETMGGRKTTTRIPYRMTEGVNRKQWLASWSRREAGYFKGTWEQSFMGPEGKWVPLHATLTTSTDPEDPTHWDVSARFATPGQPEVTQKHSWHIYPRSGAIRIVTHGENGATDQAFWGPALITDGDEFVIKALSFGGVLWRFRRVD